MSPKTHRGDIIQDYVKGILILLKRQRMVRESEMDYFTSVPSRTLIGSSPSGLGNLGDLGGCAAAMSLGNILRRRRTRNPLMNMH